MSSRYSRSFIFMLALICLFGAVGPAHANPAQPQTIEQVRCTEFYENDGLIGAAQRLKRVATGIRLLHVGAHPDDEDSALLAYLSLGRGVRVTYLSLTRGEGGQNLIGPEFFEDLGVLRTAELMAAREIDRADQLFGRQIDFGYSKTAEETFEQWGREEVVKDIVRAIRLKRPHIVTTRFSGTAADGHGQHTVSVLATRKAIDAAADPNRFPDLAAAGLEPWKVQQFYTGYLRGDIPEDALTIRTDVYDPWVGRSLGAEGYAGRSKHRSQDMGMIEYEESRPAVLIREFPPLMPGEEETDLFEGVEVSHRLLREQTWDVLERGMALLEPSTLAPDLAQILTQWRNQAPEACRDIEDIEIALATLLGIRLNVFAERPIVTTGGQVEVEAKVFTPRPMELVNARWRFDVAEGLAASEAEMPSANDLPTTLTIAASNQARPELPYYLRETPEGALYQWPDVAWAGAPFDPPAATATFLAEYLGESLSLTVPVEHRAADPAYGETRSDLAVLPPVSIRFEPDVRMVAEDGPAPEPPVVEVRNLSDETESGRLEVFIEDQPTSTLLATDLRLEPGATEIRQVSLPEALHETAQMMRLAARWIEPSETVQRGLQVDHLDYRHIRPQYLARPALMRLHRLNVNVPADLRVAYIPGSGDETGDILQQLGVNVTVVSPDAIAATDLSPFDAVLTGVRAYEVSDELVRANDRLLDYVRAGGTLIVQYNKYEFEERGVAPLPMAFARPHDRVTDEAADVTLLRPEHPAFNAPNEITPEDFEGWVQDKGLYFWSTWDEQYQPLIEVGDPGEDPKRGGLLYLPLGEGHYIYTGLAFFRQLPEGVEGAAQLLVNLLSLGQTALE